MNMARNEARSRARQAILLGVTWISGIVTAGVLPAQYQATDPFYIARLEAGAGLFEARLYQEALKELEVAALGLSSRKDLLARTYVLQGLCQAKLGDKAKSAERLAAAAELAGWEALLEIGVPEAAKPDLVKLVSDARKSPSPTATDRKTAPSLAPPEKPPAEKRPPSTPPVKIVDDKPTENPDPASAEGFKAAILADPRNPGPYYALASLYAKKNDFASARKTLLDLLFKIPAEIRGHLELGRIEYQARKLKEAERSLEKFLALAAGVTVDERLQDEALGLIILSAYLRGDAKKTKTALENGQEIFNPARLAALALSATDINRLLAVRAAAAKK